MVLSLILRKQLKMSPFVIGRKLHKNHEMTNCFIN